MKIGILGCGYVGRAAALQWKELGHTVTVSTRHKDKIPELKEVSDKVVLIESSLKPLLEGQDALLFSTAPDSADAYKSAYLDNALAIQSLAPEYPDLKQLLYTSSTSVYGDHQGAWVTEDTPLHSYHERIEILIKTEQTLLDLRTLNRNVCILRLGEIIGPGRELAHRLRERIGKSFPGTGQNFTNFSHLNTIVKGLTFALDKHLDGVYNLCEDIHIPRKDLYEGISQELGLPVPIWDPSQFSHHHGNKKVSSDKIKASGLDSFAF